MGLEWNDVEIILNKNCIVEWSGQNDIADK